MPVYVHGSTSASRRQPVASSAGVSAPSTYFLGEVEELIPEASKLDAWVNTPPSGVKKMVDDKVFGDVKKSTGLAYHLVYLPAPEKDADSIAGVMRHQYEMLQACGTGRANTNFRPAQVDEARVPASWIRRQEP